MGYLQNTPHHLWFGGNRPGISGSGLASPAQTPFLLLAAACFLRSSRRLYLWLMHHRVFGPYPRNYLQHRAISIRAKAISIILIWATITYSAFWVIQNTILRIILLLTATILSVRILLFKTLTSDITNLD
ncbi:MAG: YbaN family protein [Fidelibacterota bacterium]